MDPDSSLATVSDNIPNEAGDQIHGHYARRLTRDEVDRLQNDNRLVSNFKQAKFEKDAQKNWDLFYKRNTTKFFKDRHWTQREFQDLCETKTECNELRVLLEVGCGVGNFIYPLIAEKSNFFIFACDFSNRAIKFLKMNPLYDESLCRAFQCDITSDDLSSVMPENSVDIISLIFVLSSLHPDAMPLALANLKKVLKPNGIVLFRDYGLYDQAMLRFAPGHKLGDRFYVRQDGTRAFYFSEDYVARLFSDAGFKIQTNRYIERQTTNLKEGIRVPRIFIQSKFIKSEK